MSDETSNTEGHDKEVDRRAAMLIGGVAALTTLATGEVRAAQPARMEAAACGDDLYQAAKLIEHNRTGVVLTGTIKDGKVEFDKATMEEIARKFAGANTPFVALNAPFDPRPAALG
jgi:hypothetical protein